MGLSDSDTFAKRDIFSSGKEGENFNRRNTLSISRIKICSLTPHHGKTAVLQRSHSFEQVVNRGMSVDGGLFPVVENK
jgi:hypothetical protein